MVVAATARTHINNTFLIKSPLSCEFYTDKCAGFLIYNNVSKKYTENGSAI